MGFLQNFYIPLRYGSLCYYDNSFLLWQFECSFWCLEVKQILYVKVDG